MTKIEKNWIFGQNGHLLTVFGQKWPIFEFFSKIHLEHFFTFPKPYLTAKFQKKLMNGCLDICVTYIRTYVHTYKGQLIGLPAARPISLWNTKTFYITILVIFSFILNSRDNIIGSKCKPGIKSFQVTIDFWGYDFLKR